MNSKTKYILATIVGIIVLLALVGMLVIFFWWLWESATWRVAAFVTCFLVILIGSFVVYAIEN